MATYTITVRHDRVMSSDVTVEALNVAHACNVAEREALRMTGQSGKATHVRWRDGTLYTVAAAKRVEAIENSRAFHVAANGAALAQAGL